MVKITKENFHFYIRKKIDSYYLVYVRESDKQEYKTTFSSMEGLSYFLDDHENYIKKEVGTNFIYVFKCSKCGEEIYLGNKNKVEKGDIVCNKCGKLGYCEVDII